MDSPVCQKQGAGEHQTNCKLRQFHAHFPDFEAFGYFKIRRFQVAVSHETPKTCFQMKPP